MGGGPVALILVVGGGVRAFRPNPVMPFWLIQVPGPKLNQGFLLCARLTLKVMRMLSGLVAFVSCSAFFVLLSMLLLWDNVIRE